MAARPAPVAAGTTPSAAIASTEVPVSSPIVDLAVDGPPVPAPDVASSTVAVAQQAPVPAGRTQGRSGPGAATVRLPATGIGTTTTAALAVITTLLGTFTRRATRRRVPVAPRS